MTSQSAETRREIRDFAENAPSHLTRIQRQLAKDAFVFAPAKGIALSKKGKSSIRPLVVAPVESRIVQRAVLDVLLRVPAVQRYAESPYSFGGIKKRPDHATAAVPAAIEATLAAIQGGATYVIRSDISSFFTRIPKPWVTEVIADAVREPEFIELFTEAITVELCNLAQLREHVSAFPIEDIGVAQGNSLSPLLGNILLSRFDRELNTDNVRCIRYIDDFLILASDKASASRHFDKALALLAEHGLQVSEEKTARGPVEKGFQFLGIELANGIIRPSPASRRGILEKVRVALSRGIRALHKYGDTHQMERDASLIRVLHEVSGIVNGWANQYRFCNEGNLFSQLDEAIDREIREYFRIFNAARAKADQHGRRRLLGIPLIRDIASSPLAWPKRSKEPSEPVAA